MSTFRGGDVCVDISERGTRQRERQTLGIDAPTAFELLRWRSQQANVKLLPLAEQLVADFTALGGESLPPRSAYDNLRLTAHERVSPDLTP